jgi:hypothetical protein
MALVSEKATPASLYERCVLPPKLSLLLAVFAIAGAIVMAYVAAQTARSPRETIGLVPVQPEVDLGKVEQGSVTARFDLVNRSSSPVAILRVVTSCGCTEAKIVAKEIKPSEHIDLSCLWDTRGRRGKNATSLVVIYKDTESGHADSCRLIARADIVPEFAYDPDELVFNAGVPATKTVTFSAARNPDFTLKEAYCSQSAFAAELRQTTQEVVVRFDPAKWEDDPRFLHEEIVVETNSLKEPKCRIPMRVVNSPR